MVEMKGGCFILQPWDKKDSGELASVADNKNIARNMVDSFPFPYTLKDAEGWVEIASGKNKMDKTFVIEFDGKLAGGVGFDLKDGLREGVADGGYWLGEEFWGKGIVSEAWGLVVDYIFENFDVRKVEAGVFSWNPASVRVLEKCGFKREAVLREGVVRFGEVCDEFRFGLLREEWDGSR